MSSDGMKYFSRKITWQKSENAEFPYECDDYEECENCVGNMKIRINDFPAEPMYSLLVNDTVLCDFDDWPVLWKKV